MPTEMIIGRAKTKNKCGEGIVTTCLLTSIPLMTYNELMDIAETQLQSINKSFPNVSWSSYSYIDEGWDHAVIIIDNRLVFRFPLDAEYLERLKHEIKVVALVQPLVKVKIPQYTHIDSKGLFAGYEIVPGQTMTSGAFKLLKPEDKVTFTYQLADFLSTIHTLTSDQLDFSLVPPTDIHDYHKDLQEQVQQYLKNTMTVTEYIEVQNILDEAGEVLLLPHPKVFLHGDIYYRHLLWDGPNKQLGIIDFSDMNIGDPAFDFAELHEYGFDFVKHVYDLYSGPKDDTFLERAWTYQKLVAVYMLVDHFLYHKTSFKIARETFDRVLLQNRIFKEY